MRLLAVVPPMTRGLVVMVTGVVVAAELLKLPLMYKLRPVLFNTHTMFFRTSSEPKIEAADAADTIAPL